MLRQHRFHGLGCVLYRCLQFFLLIAHRCCGGEIALAFIKRYQTEDDDRLKGPHAYWNQASLSCVETNAVRNKVNYLVSCIADLITLALALCGIWLTKCDGKFWKLVYYQASTPKLP